MTPVPQIRISLAGACEEEAFLGGLQQMLAVLADHSRPRKILDFLISTPSEERLSEKDFFRLAVQHASCRAAMVSLVEAFVGYPRCKYVYRNPEETALCHAVFALATQGEVYFSSVIRYLAAIDMDHDVFNRENLIPCLEEIMGAETLISRFAAHSIRLSEWYEDYLEG